ncbi:DUF4350 domain-containing protein [Erythrobacter sp. Alg231-14]|uniref:DUF4350 domain-containing protein n=1 Tax=Erythrobacter sp. Alg231-14 TaxID=1922225 RepID=UPI000D551497
MTGQSNTSPRMGASPFGRGAVLAVLLVGFTTFIAMLYFIGAGDTGGKERGGAAHAAANGLNGYSALVELLEAEGYDVERSRGRSGLETNGLLILTPSSYADAEEISVILSNREYVGPTLVVLPKWFATQPGNDIVDEDAERMKRDWVQLLDASPSAWPSDLPAPFTINQEIDTLNEDESPFYDGLRTSGELPTQTIQYANEDSNHDPIVADSAGHALVVNVVGTEGTDYYENAHWTMFVVEPDLVNNYGLSDPQRAATALALIQEAGYGDTTTITFDMTLNGFGNSVNLLTLAFEPPFLAATLCLILAMLIIGWRAFLRFGPPVAPGQEIAFGKKRLVANGAGLIVRARRLGLLAAPYTALIERRLARSLGIVRPDPEAIDRAMAARMPDQEPFSNLAARLHNADKPMDILRAAQDLSALSESLTGKK